MESTVESKSLVRRVAEPTPAGFSIQEVPFLGYQVSKSGAGDLVQLVLADTNDYALIEKGAVALQGLEKMTGRGYVGSAVLGLPGEGSSAQLAGGILCLMPCHWAMYAAAAAKFTPLAAYFAAKPSCCHADPDPVKQAMAVALDVVFYATIAGLGGGAARRLLRRSTASKAGTALDQAMTVGGQLPDLNHAAVWCPDFYADLERQGAADGIAQAQAGILAKEYVRPSESFGGKVIDLARRSNRRLALAMHDDEYADMRASLDRSFSRLAARSEESANDLPVEQRPYAQSLARVYRAESAAQASSLSVGGLGRKFMSYVKGFGENKCLYKPPQSA